MYFLNWRKDGTRNHKGQNIKPFRSNLMVTLNWPLRSCVAELKNFRHQIDKLYASSWQCKCSRGCLSAGIAKSHIFIKKSTYYIFYLKKKHQSANYKKPYICTFHHFFSKWM